MSTIIVALGSYAGILVILLMIITVVLIFVTVNLSMRVSRLQRRYRAFMRGSDGTSIEKELNSRLNMVDKFDRKQDDFQENLKLVENVINKSVHKYGIVKYDAFDDVGGKLSFVLALLDDEDSGFVLNAVHSKENCFLYIKEILKGESYIMLSNEEIQALRIAKRYGTEEQLTL